MLKYEKALQNLSALNWLVQVVPFSLHSLTDTRQTPRHPHPHLRRRSKTFRIK